MPVGTMVEATFLGSNSAQFGHAILDCPAPGCSSPGIYREVTLRNRNPIHPDLRQFFHLKVPLPCNICFSTRETASPLCKQQDHTYRPNPLLNLVISDFDAS
jgi:hypothetical protein